MYTVPLKDIEYIGYFGAKGNSEEIKSAYSRIAKQRGRVPVFLFNAELFDFNTRAAASDVVSGGWCIASQRAMALHFPIIKMLFFHTKTMSAPRII